MRQRTKILIDLLDNFISISKPLLFILPLISQTCSHICSPIEAGKALRHNKSGIFIK